MSTNITGLVAGLHVQAQLMSKAKSVAGQDAMERMFGQALSVQLRWLESTVGLEGVRKFHNGKIRQRPFSGQYVTGVVHNEQGRVMLCSMIDALKRGEMVPLCDVDSYYRRNREWPQGMRIEGSQLIDVWTDETTQTKPTKVSAKARRCSSRRV
jgi:hypothetical protein